MNQRSFASAEYALKKKRTRREKCVADMERVVPWARLIAVIEPLYPTSGRVGRQPIGVPRMLRMYACSSGAAWQTRRWKMPCTTARHCATSWASTCRANRCPMTTVCESQHPFSDKESTLSSLGVKQPIDYMRRTREWYLV